MLASLSPYGFDAMSGRWAYLSDSADGCAAALGRLRLILDAAAAAMLGLPSANFDPGRPAAHSIVVAYDLTRTDPGAVAALRHRAPGQIVFERATRWTDPPRVTADVSGLLSQAISPPWAAQPRLLDDDTAGRSPADDRPITAITAEITGTTPQRDDGDGSAPPDQ